MNQRTELEPRVLFVALVIGMFFVTPFGLAENIPDCFFGAHPPAGVMLQPNLILDLSRQDIDFPGELLWAANLVPVNNLFWDALKQVQLGGFKVKDVKAVGIAFNLFLGSLVIGMFYLFYRNCRTVEEDPDIEGFEFKMKTGL